MTTHRRFDAPTNFTNTDAPKAPSVIDPHGDYHRHLGDVLERDAARSRTNGAQEKSGLDAALDKAAEEAKALSQAGPPACASWVRK